MDGDGGRETQKGSKCGGLQAKVDHQALNLAEVEYSTYMRIQNRNLHSRSSQGGGVNLGVALSGGDIQYTSLLLNPPSLSSWIANEFSSPLLSQSRGEPSIRDTGTCPLLGLEEGPINSWARRNERKKGFRAFFRGCQEEEEKIACGTERNAHSNSIM